MNRKLVRSSLLPVLVSLVHCGLCQGQLRLEVDSFSGSVQMVNSPLSSTGPIELDGYSVTSLSESLDATNWLSLASQGFSEWTEISNVGDTQIGEISLTGSLTLNLGESLFLGQAFRSAGNPDLEFQYTGAGGAAVGIVDYLLAPSLLGDFNADGIVSHADYSVMGDGWGIQFTPEDFAAYRASFGSILAAAAPASVTSLSTGILPFSVTTSSTAEGNTQWDFAFSNVEGALAGHLNIESDGATILAATGGDTFLDDGIDPVGVPGFTALGGIAEGVAIEGTSVFAALGSTLDAPLPGPTRPFLTLVTEGSLPTLLAINGQYGYGGIDYDLNLTAGTPGSSPEFPILPDSVQSGEFEFEDVPSGSWFDPPLVPGFEYAMLSDSLFTAILDFPPGFAAPFEVVAEGDVLGQFGPGESVDFVALLGHGVKRFVVRDISPLVDAEDPTAFPLKIAFSSDTASFRMVAIPEPGSLLLVVLGLAQLLLPRCHSSSSRSPC